MASKIEWLCDPVTRKPGYTVNPVKGMCPVDCKDNQGKSYCYARRNYIRFRRNPEIRYDRIPLLDIDGISKPSKIFVGSTMELFGPWVKSEWLADIFDFVREFPQHTFIFLTKQPQNLPKEWPDNCWVGVSATDNKMAWNGFAALHDRCEAKVKFLSLEPLLGEIDARMFTRGSVQSTINWVIIGQQTPPKASTSPRLEWIKEIVQAADNAGVPVFLKDNLKPILGDNLRQEYPRGNRLLISGILVSLEII